LPSAVQTMQLRAIAALIFAYHIAFLQQSI